MFLREVPGCRKKYLHLVKSIRKGKTVRQETIFSFGAIDELNEKEIQGIAKKFLSYCKNSSMIDLFEEEEIERCNWGAIAVLNKLWRELEIDNLINKISVGRKSTFNLSNIMRLLLADRLCHPKSKLQSFLQQSFYYGIKKVDLQHIYRALDLLADNKEQIEEHCFKVQNDRYNFDLTAVLYDVTTIFFESQNQDELKDFGFSKDCKFNEVQVVIGFLIDKNGVPLGFDLYSGNTYEGSTLENAIHKLKQKFNIKKVIVVADRGINSGVNLLKILDEGLDYVMGSRIKNLPKQIQEQVKDISKYNNSFTVNEDEYKYQRINHVRKVKCDDGKTRSLNETIIATWSKKRAKKDAHDRQRLVEKANEILESTPKKDNRGAKRYIKEQAENKTFDLDEKKIDADASWDGFYGIATSDTNLSEAAIINSYKSLWKIEALIRTFKNHLEGRPVFHWNPKRIKGHFCICFISLVLERYLEYLTDIAGNKLSETQVRTVINSLQFSKITVGEKTAFLFSKIDEMATTLLNQVGIKHPKGVMKPQDFEKLVS